MTNKERRSGRRKPCGFLLPHHRTYGSVYGGSSRTIEVAVQSDEGWQTELREEGCAIGVVHVAGPGIPPRATAVIGRPPCPLPIEPALHQALEACPWSFPLTPENAAQFAPHPAVKLLEHPFGLRQPEVLQPARRMGVRVLTVDASVRPRPWRSVVLSLLRNRFTLLAATRRRGCL